MKAAICTRYGAPDVVQIQDRPIPTVGKHEVLVKVLAAAVNSGDSRIRSLNVPKGFGVLLRLAMGISRPRNPILGVELCGEVCAVGRDVTLFRVGDKVFADCGMSMGGHAQFRVFNQDDVISKAPNNIALKDAGAVIFGGSTAYYFLMQKAKLVAGEHVLINGASGTVGLAAIQLAKYIGATVTAVCSEKNAELVRSLGADHVIDYTHRRVLDGATQYDVIMDNVGNLNWRSCQPFLHSNGRLLKVVATLSETLGAVFINMLSNKHCISGTAIVTTDMLQAVKSLVEKNALRPIIDRTYALDDIQAAYRYVDAHHKKGSVLLMCHDE